MAERAPGERMSFGQFLEWASTQERGRFEQLGHARRKARVWRTLGQAIAAIAARGPICEALPDGITVPIDDLTSFEPDALVRCGDSLQPETISVPDPLIVVEVISLGSHGIDTNI